MTREDWLAFRTAETCQVCDKPLEGDSVGDHCHITGVYLGTAHNACNLKLRLNPKTTSISWFFTTCGVDAGYLESEGQGELYPQQYGEVHLFLSFSQPAGLMQAISKVEGRVSCIPNNTEKYLSFSLGHLRFIDSAQFLLACLDKLAVVNTPGAFQITAQNEPNRERREL